MPRAMHRLEDFMFVWYLYKRIDAGMKVSQFLYVPALILQDPVDMFLNFVKRTYIVFKFYLRFQKETKNDFDHSKVLLII